MVNDDGRPNAMRDLEQCTVVLTQACSVSLNMRKWFQLLFPDALSRASERSSPAEEEEEEEEQEVAQETRRREASCFGIASLRTAS